MSNISITTKLIKICNHYLVVTDFVLKTIAKEQVKLSYSDYELDGLGLFNSFPTAIT